MTEKYKLLDDAQVLRETAWFISLHLEHFDCKDSTLPCQECRNTANKLAPLFLVGIEAVASMTLSHSKIVAQTALDQIAKQKWVVNHPWKSFSIPVPKGDVYELPRAKSLFDQDKEKVKYKLVKRHKDVL